MGLTLPQRGSFIGMLQMRRRTLRRVFSFAVKAPLIELISAQMSGFGGEAEILRSTRALPVTSVLYDSDSRDLCAN